ncbi:hypothetical protein [Metallibacterium sp.]|uniref:hypothetical protein n=1 Tax=Metallibacterium sp. TaxID=2940281 RepID=UPI00261C6C1D|nr:hypothetical protein [Metallibacterium sp.]
MPDRKAIDASSNVPSAFAPRQVLFALAVTLALWAASRLAQRFLSGAQVAPFGWATWIALAVLLLAVFLVAYFPARRAARAEPAESLHEL